MKIEERRAASPAADRPSIRARSAVESDLSLQGWAWWTQGFMGQNRELLGWKIGPADPSPGVINTNGGCWHFDLIRSSPILASCKRCLQLLSFPV